MTKLTHSPWGRPDHQKEVAPGIIDVETPRHGGYWLSPERLQEMAVRQPLFVGLNTCGRGPWFEEDQEWALVVLAFPECFSAGKCNHATQSLYWGYPKVYAALYPDRKQAGECTQCGGAGYYADDRFPWKPDRPCGRCFPEPIVPSGTAAEPLP